MKYPWLCKITDIDFFKFSVLDKRAPGHDELAAWTILIVGWNQVPRHDWLTALRKFSEEHILLHE